MPDRHEQLKALINSLRPLVLILNGINECTWTGHFRSCLALAEQLDRDGFTQNDLNELSSLVTRVYGGMGSFSDYVPHQDDREKMNELHSQRSKVYNNASDLRVIRTY